MGSRPRAIAYVDGFNFYHGAVKRDPALKWLDFQGLCEELLADHLVRRVSYYTARVDDRPDDPRQSQRQDVYLRALATRPKIDIVYGQFRTNRKRVRLADGQLTLVEAMITEEKGSDVNLATDLLWDACHDELDAALILSNDFDLQRPLARVMDLGVKVFTANPHRHRGQRPSLVGTEARRLRRWHLQKHQLHAVILDAAGRRITRPAEWT